MMNPNTLWSEVLVDALYQSGLRYVCIAPGSRSTPLTLAFAQHQGVKSYVHLDERSAGFFALGLALASQRAVALLCTSGSAAANFFPAVVEASASGVPLIVLTADRPAELRHSGANQTIDQRKLYGDYALWAVDMPQPEQGASDGLLRSLKTLAARVMAVAEGERGVVQMNVGFRKPLGSPPPPIPTPKPSPRSDHAIHSQGCYNNP
ncbi:MAG: 2-succinyl-5-enolpyruvyl-6-hydroxy-3-cyclohexene-1-carboxylic-acid synthase [Deinococcales bacterium]